MIPENELYSSLRDQIADQLRKDINAGRLVADQRLYQSELIERFKVSRTPVRDALALLIQEGLLEAMPNRGVRVAATKNSEILETSYTVRRIVEISALKSYFKSLTEEDFLIWDLILARMRDASEKGDHAALSELDHEFHLAIVKRSEIRDFELMWKIAASCLLNRFLYVVKEYTHPKEIYSRHVKLLEVLRSGDLDVAIESLSAYIDFSNSPFCPDGRS